MIQSKKKGRPGEAGAPFRIMLKEAVPQRWAFSVIAHAAARRAGGRSLLLLGDLGDKSLGGEEEACDGSRILQGAARDFRGIHHAVFDQVLIKDNHLAALRQLLPNAKITLIIKNALETAKKRAQKNVKIEIEVRNMAEFEEALSAGCDIIMLDNMHPDRIKEPSSNWLKKTYKHTILPAVKAERLKRDNREKNNI